MNPTAPVAFAAADWLERSRRDDFTDWEGLTAWLEEAPSHADAFARLSVLEDALVADYAAQATTTSVPAEARRPNRKTPWMRAAAVAAVAFGALVLWQGQGPARQVYLADGGVRTIALPSGDRAVMAPGSRLALIENAPRHAQVLSGEVYFSVRHDPERPFDVILPGGERVVDLGTRFVVSGADGVARVAVSEGLVRFTATGVAQDIKAGETLVARGSRVSVRAIARADVAAWADAPLTFDEARLEDVAQRLSQTTGVPLKVRPDIANRRFTATIFVDARQDAEPHRLAAILGLVATRDGDGWVLSED